MNIKRLFSACLLATALALPMAITTTVPAHAEKASYIYNGDKGGTTPLGLRNKVYESYGVKLGECLASKNVISDLVYRDGNFRYVRTCYQWHIDEGNAEFPTGTIFEIDWRH